MSPSGRPLSLPARFARSAHASCLIESSHFPRSVGRFLLSPITRVTDSGHFVASLSIRSGRGRGTHDRVFRFTPLFGSAQAAARYALDQGLDYVAQPQLPA